MPPRATRPTTPRGALPGGDGRTGARRAASDGNGRTATPGGPPVTASAYVAEQIRAEILRGGFPAGSRLDQEALAERFGVSIIPIREALKRLEAEGLVRMTPRRGAFVAELTLKELTEISWIRERLEELAIRIAAPHLTEADLDELDQINDRMVKVAGRARPDVWNALNRRWHFTLYGAGDSTVLIEMLGLLWDRTTLYRRVLATREHIERSAQVQPGSVEQHAEIVERLRAGDVAGATRVIKQHIRRAMKDTHAT